MSVDQQDLAGATAPSLPPRVLVAVMAGATKVGVVLDASAPVSAQMSALVDVINGRLEDLGQPVMSPGPGRGRWGLCRVDGTPLKLSRSLADQGARDGIRLWLRFIPDSEARINVVEHVTSAVAQELTKRWPGLSAAWAGRVGAAMVVCGVAAATALMLRWRFGHMGWGPSIFCAVLALVLIGAAVITLARCTDSADGRRIGDTLLLIGCVPAAVSAAALVPGPVGAPHAALGVAMLMSAAVLIVRFTGRYIALGTTVIIAGAAAGAAALARMTLVTSAVTLLGVVLLVSILLMHLAPTVARWAAGIRLPVFPSASGRWIFETRPDLPTDKVVASGGITSYDGPQSVRDVVVCTDRAHAYLSGLLIGTTAVMVVCCVGLCDPHAPRRGVALLVAGLVAVAVLLRGRSFTDRWQATVLAGVAVAVVIGVGGRYVLGLWTLTALLVGTSVMVAVPVAGLVAGVVVPNRFYTPTFRKIVEWIEYFCLAAIFPLTFWLMGVLAAIRYR
ncbi:type VII secretion integral membrane protein EccD [Mycobacterium gordonae]|uniref:Type VII secretion integral membrane protein EccD n=1 Tax=Mycobacterium gordonae TaxID=1778 RepID=A0A0Q2RYM3_MYCGO|nr:MULTISPECIES: type VII secretion integral membrane protein EccD [Mycobacterium]KQH80363.1 type VII secretion integral membrane protein EccD [Mycobacterium gordonae]MDP7707192.1 type VII secretion integral membrane protein EccD [Mycobacterium sp. TY815]